MNKIVNILSGCTKSLKEDFSHNEQLILSELFAFRSLAENEVLLRQGEQDDALSIVVSGDIMVNLETVANEEVALHHLKPGDVAGAMGFVDGDKHTATLRASKPSSVITLKREDLEGLIDSHPRIIYKLMRMIVRSVHKTVLRMDQQFVEMSNYITRMHGPY